MTMLPPDPIYIFNGEMASVSCVKFQITKEIQRVFAGTQSGDVHVWSLKSKREIGNFKAGDDVCLSICIPEEEEETVITHTKSGQVAFWREDDSKWVLKTLINVDFFGFCKSHIFENVLYVPVKSSQCQLISVKTCKTLKMVKLSFDKCGEIMAFKVFSLGSRKVILIAHEGHSLSLWDLEETEMLGRLEVSDCPMAVDFDVGTSKGLCGDPSDKVTVFSLDRNFQFKIERSVTLTNSGVAAVRIRPDGRIVAVGCWDGKLRLYSWKSLVLLAVLDTHSGTVQDVSFTRNYEEGLKSKYLLAAASQDSTVSLWDLYNQTNK